MKHLIKHRITRRQSLTLIGTTLTAMTLPTVSLLANTGGMQQKTFAGTDKTLPLSAWALGEHSTLAVIRSCSMCVPK